MKYEHIREAVFNFPTKHKQGFVKEEIKELLKKFPDISILRFEDSLECITVMRIQNEIVIYRHDIVNAIYSGIRQ